MRIKSPAHVFEVGGGLSSQGEMGLLSSAATVFFLCACGTVLTLYAVHVQRSRLDDARYRALCDVDEVITCSEIVAEDRDFVELVEWACHRVGVAYNGKFNPRQPAFRIAFFPLLCFLGCLPLSISYFTATFISSVASLVSAYLLYMQFQVHDQICLPCLAEYFIHILLFLVLVVRWANSGRGESREDHTRTPAASVRTGSNKQKKSAKSAKQKSRDKVEKGKLEKDRVEKESSEDHGENSGGEKVVDPAPSGKTKSSGAHKRKQKAK